MFRITGVVKHLLIINVLIFLVRYVVDPEMYWHLALYYPGLELFKPYQLVTHMFTHANTMHLLFNMLSLYFLGPMVENYLGTKRFLLLYFISGFGSLILHLAMAYFGVINYLSPYGEAIPMVGASGAIMGVFVAFGMIFPNVKLMLIFPPIPIKAKYLILLLVGFDLFSGVSGFNDSIAHFAHLGGALFGFLLILYWKSLNFKT